MTWMRSLGRTDIKVSALGLGTVKLGRDQGVKYPHGFKIPDDVEARALLDLARDLGINFVDTAPAYGNSEERLGTLLAAQRSDWVICSKVGEEFADGQSSFDFTPEHTRVSVQRSLARLQTHYIDMVLVHSNGDDLRIINEFGTLEALADLKQEGLIRAYGISTKTVQGGEQAAAICDTVMLTYNPGDTKERTVLDACAQNQSGALIKKALASGHLSSTLGDPVQASMDLIFAHPGTTSAIVGTINPVHLKKNVSAANRALS